MWCTMPNLALWSHSLRSDVGGLYEVAVFLFLSMMTLRWVGLSLVLVDVCVDLSTSVVTCIAWSLLVASRKPCVAVGMKERKGSKFNFYHNSMYTSVAISWLLPVFQHSLRNKLQAIECYINHSGWYLFHRMCCKVGEQPWSCPIGPQDLLK